jgi:hypothetical protein
MPPELLSQLSSLGVAGLLFLMWWVERHERTRGVAALADALQYVRQVTDVNRSLLDVIQANTEALTGLREELRSHRASEAEWLGRLAQRLETLGCVPAGVTAGRGRG